MGEELTTKELMDLRVILISFMVDKEAHKKIPRLESRAPKLWDKVDRLYKYRQKGNEGRELTNKTTDLTGNNRHSAYFLISHYDYCFYFCSMLACDFGLPLSIIKSTLH
jgi:hypothetical protein